MCAGVKCRKLGIFISSALAYFPGTMPSFSSRFCAWEKYENHTTIAHSISCQKGDCNENAALICQPTCTYPCRTGKGTTEYLKLAADGQTLVQSWSMGICRYLGGGTWKHIEQMKVNWQLKWVWPWWKLFCLFTNIMSNSPSEFSTLFMVASGGVLSGGFRHGRPCIYQGISQTEAKKVSLQGEWGDALFKYMLPYMTWPAVLT